MARFTIDGYGQIELNRVSFPTTGRVIADLPLAAGFTTAAPAENGMILAYNYAGGEVALPTEEQIANGGAMFGLHYSPEKEYNPLVTGLKNFSLVAGAFYPRLGILSTGDRFTTNCLDIGSTGSTNAAKGLIANCATVPVYGEPSVSGAIKLTATLPTTGVALQVINATTMPDGTYGVKFVTIAAQ